MAMALRGETGLREEMAARGVTADVADPSGRTLLMYAVHFAARCRGTLRRRTVAGVICLLQNGADPNRTDDRGETALTLAITYRQKDIAILLLEHGAKPQSAIQ